MAPLLSVYGFNKGIRHAKAGVVDQEAIGLHGLESV
jgi:hypothetical protein